MINNLKFGESNNCRPGSARSETKLTAPITGAKLNPALDTHIDLNNDTHQNLLALVGSSETKINGYGLQSILNHILEARDEDPEVDLIIKGLLKLIKNSSYCATDSKLASELNVQQSVSIEIISAYLEWIAHRGAKEKAASDEEQNSARSLDPAFLKTRINAIIDLILVRIVDLNLAIPKTIEIDVTKEMLSEWENGNLDFKITLIGNSSVEHQRALTAVEAILKDFRKTTNDDPNTANSFTCSLSKKAVLQLSKFTDLIKINREINVAESFLNLFHGGAVRIQNRANLLMLNEKIEEIYETEEALKSGAKISNQELFKAIWTINELDGGTPIGYQKPIAVGETRLLEGQRIDRHTLPQNINSLSLIVTQDSSISAIERRDAHINILQQSPLAQRAISKMEEKLTGLASDSIEYAQSLDVLRTYSATMLYDSHHLWQSQGVIDRLLEVSVTVGTQDHRESAIDFLNSGIEKIGSIIHKDFQGNFCQIYLATMNLILSRESWDPQTLDFVFEKLKWLQSFTSGRQMSTLKAEQAFDEIISVRRQDIPDNTQLLNALRIKPGKAKVIDYASYSIKLEIKNESASGQKGKVLEISYPQTKLEEDTEDLYHIYNIGELAKEEGFIAIQLVDWPYNPAKRVRATEEYLEINDTAASAKRNSSRTEPIFIRNLTTRELENQLPTRGTYNDYMRMQFKTSQELDLSAESELLNTDAHRYRQNHGGKAMGLAILERLLIEFADQRLQLLPHLNCKQENLNKGIKIPSNWTQRGSDSNLLICRSNAAFEYGCPPGILNSIAKLKVDKNGVLQTDLSSLQSGFNNILNQYDLDSRVSYQVLIQPQLHPRASGIVYSSFSGSKNEETIIEASLGPPVSATTGLANLLHYRVQNGKITSHRNFEGETPAIIFHENSCLLDRSEDPSRRELDLYKSITSDVQDLRLSELKSIWQANTFKIPTEPHSPLMLEELVLLNKFAKFAESKLNKPIKLEFGIGNDGTVYILQLDPAMLDVDKTNLNFSNEHEGVIVESPFVNMPLNAEGLDVLVEIAASSFTKIPEDNFVFVAETTPLNINIQNDLAKPYPQCLGIITPSGSRMNHCYSEARTFIPMMGFIGIGDAMRKVMVDLKWGDNPGLKMDIKSDGRWGRVRIYKVDAE